MKRVYNLFLGLLLSSLACLVIASCHDDKVIFIDPEAQETPEETPDEQAPEYHPLDFKVAPPKSDTTVLQYSELLLLVSFSDKCDISLQVDGNEVFHSAKQNLFRHKLPTDEPGNHKVVISAATDSSKLDAEFSYLVMPVVKLDVTPIMTDELIEYADTLVMNIDCNIACQISVKLDGKNLDTRTFAESYQVIVPTNIKMGGHQIEILASDDNSSDNFDFPFVVSLPLIHMVDVELAEGGSAFYMGAESSKDALNYDPDAQKDESPAHKVLLTNPYSIGKFEVTQKLWEAVTGSNPSETKDYNSPVTNILWSDVVAFLNKLNDITDMEYRFPTEAEWEFAARGGILDEQSYISGVGKPKNFVWYFETSDGQIHRVGTLMPNELGIYDMSGNVKEWVYDFMAPYNLNNEENPETDPTGKNGKFHITRGGSFSDDLKFCRVSYRTNSGESIRYENIGVRLALSKK
ncbi:MAG: formylglycine-generating enzyme family protein [Bacteroidales bacterium]|nr:formylglycine-generating enzyme family protein [Bacteroidales bacterium]